MALTDPPVSSGAPSNAPASESTAGDGDAGGTGGLRPGDLVAERYRVIQPLGEGGMGAVYLVEHAHMRKRYALKVLHGEMLERPEFVTRFEREAMAAAHINHPNVAAATDFGRTANGAFYMVLEYVEGRSLRDAIEDGPLGDARALVVTRQIASALARAHELGIVHRDLKPENVMLGEHDAVKVLDFGIAKLSIEALGASASGSAPLTQAGTVFGTPDYMAPEQAMGDAVDGRADLYALGTILYEMLAGVRPFASGGDIVSVLAQQVTAPVPPIAQRAPSVSAAPELEGIARRLLAKSPDARFPNAGELLAALEALHTFGPSPMRPDPSPTPQSRAIIPANASLATGSSGANLRTVAAPAIRPPQKALGARLKHLQGIVLDRVEKVRPELPPAVRTLPASALLAIAAASTLLPILMLFGLVSLVFGGHSKTSADGGLEPDANAPSVVDLAAAKAQGAHALEELSQKHPGDPAIGRELVLAYGGDGQYTKAMRTLAPILSRVAPDVSADKQVGAVVIGAMGAKSDEAQDAAFAVLKGPMGAAGVDILFECAQRHGFAEDVAARCEKTLQLPGITDAAAPPLKAYILLQVATDCESKRAALPAVIAAGDARTLPLLTALKKTYGCGRRGRADCFACLRQDPNFDLAIATVKSRL